MFERQLFEGDLIRLTVYDPEKDAEVESKWTEDSDYMHAIGERPAYPLAVHLVRKKHEERVKEAEKNRLFFWAVRKQDDDRLVGWAALSNFEWTHGSGEISLGIGSPADRNQGFGADAMRLALRFAFDELNLHRLRLVIPAYNEGALRFARRFGFIEEVRRREALWLNGTRYDELWLGLLQQDVVYG
jgi:RimJ/RimL family protein N-acetyltransferase